MSEKNTLLLRFPHDDLVIHDMLNITVGLDGKYTKNGFVLTAVKQALRDKKRLHEAAKARLEQGMAALDRECSDGPDESQRYQVRDACIDVLPSRFKAFTAALKGGDLEGEDLRKQFLVGSDLSGANLRKANLRGADLSLCNLDGSDLNGADLKGAKLNSATVRDADLRLVNLDTTECLGTDMSGSEADGIKWNTNGSRTRGIILPNFDPATITGGNDCHDTVAALLIREFPDDIEIRQIAEFILSRLFPCWNGLVVRMGRAHENRTDDLESCFGRYNEKWGLLDRWELAKAEAACESPEDYGHLSDLPFYPRFKGYIDWRIRIETNGKVKA